MTNLERYKTKDISSGTIAAEILGYVSTLKGLSNIQFTDYIQDLKDFLDAEAKDENESTEIEEVLKVLKDYCEGGSCNKIILYIGSKKLVPTSSKYSQRYEMAIPRFNKYKIHLITSDFMDPSSLKEVKIIEVSGLSKDDADYLLKNGIKGEVM